MAPVLLHLNCTNDIEETRFLQAGDAHGLGIDDAGEVIDLDLVLASLYKEQLISDKWCEVSVS